MLALVDPGTLRRHVNEGGIEDPTNVTVSRASSQSCSSWTMLALSDWACAGTAIRDHGNHDKYPVNCIAL